MISDNIWQAVIGGIVTLLLAWMNIRLNRIAKTGERTHDLINSGVGDLLDRHKEATRRLANLPNAPESDKDAAVIAEQASDEHQKAQAVADSKETKS